jgi:ADP-ribose pyrophosphatase
MPPIKKEFEIIRQETLYQGFFKLVKFRLRHTLFQGGWSRELVRELFLRGSCVAVIPYDPIRDQVVLIEQFRIGATTNETPWLLEIVAGAIEDGESAIDVAYRETREEAGCEIRELIRICEFFTSPGGSSEKITLFCALVDTTNLGGVHGLEEEDEDILVRAVDFAEAMEQLVQGRIDSAIPIIGLQWLALNRERWQPLRAR